jgi:hypothetical protein
MSGSMLEISVSIHNCVGIDDEKYIGIFIFFGGGMCFGRGSSVGAYCIALVDAFVKFTRAIFL